jgi:hypothetical protein
MKNDDLEKKTLNLRRGDWDFLESIFRPNGIPTSLAVRSIISNYVDQHRTETKLPDLETDL